MVGTRRARQAAETHREILDAARKLFAAQGYAATTMHQIADEAGVSVQTIYDSVGSKAALLDGLNDLIEVAAGVRELAARLATETDPERILSIPTTITRRILETSGDLVRAGNGASQIGATLSSVRDEGARRHRAGVGRIVQRLDDLGHLAPGVDVAEASDVVAALTDARCGCH